MNDNFETTPQALRNAPRWVVWRYQNRNGARTKVPYQPNGQHATSTDPATWCSYEEAIAANEKGNFSGIGFMLGNGFAGVDLDEVIDSSGQLNPIAERTISDLNSYAEVSPSGNGVKVFVRGTVGKGCRGKIDGANVEVYGENRFFTVTGEKLHDSPGTVADAQPVLSDLAAQLHGTKGGASKSVEASWPDKPSVDDLSPWLSRVGRLSESISGDRGHDAVYAAACQIRRWCLNESDSWQLMVHYNDTRCEPPWDDCSKAGSDSLHRKFVAGCVAVVAESTTAEEDFALVATGDFALTDLGNAERIAAHFGGGLRYVAAWKQWLWWDGVKWAIDTTGVAMQRAKEMARSILREADAADGERRKKIVGHALASESRTKLAAAIDLASTEKPIPATAKDFDAEPMLLNTDAGTVDLRTGELRAHDPSDQLAKTTGTGYATGDDWVPEAWGKFLDRTFGGDSELIGFVQRLFGYALIGEQREHVFPILWGGGANGKSVFIGALQYSLGDYATTAAPKLFVSKRNETHPTELADLAGRRLVVLSETERQASLNEALVKSITGGDRIKARRMREDFWEFDPSHLAVMVTNHKPAVHGIDEGIWRRLLLVPFNEFIPPNERDARLPQKLRSEAAGILRWQVEGCLAYQRDGLNAPSTVRAATDAYRADSDPLFAWLAVRCRQGGGLQAGATELLESFNQHERDASRVEVTAIAFAGRLVAAGFKKLKRRNGNVYVGLTLLDG